jgi:putative peptidoglycan lipid II flippase
MGNLYGLFRQHKTKLILGKISAVQVFINFFTSLLILRTVGIGGELDVFYIGMAVFAFLYSSVNWSLSSVLAPYLIEHRGEGKEGRLLVTVLCITVPVALLLAVTMPLWTKVLYINYIGEIDFNKILWVQGILIGAYFVDGFILVYTAMLQEKNKYITFNLSMMVASLVGFLFVYFSIEHIGVYAAAINQLLMKIVIATWMTLLFFKSIKPYMAFEKEQFMDIFHRAKYILLGSLYFKTDEVVERFIASYLTSGFVSLVSFIQRVYGAIVSVLNAAIGIPSITVFANYLKEGQVNKIRPILLKYILGLSLLSISIFMGIYLYGEWFFAWMMGDKLPQELIPTLNMAILILFAFVFFKPISLVLQSLLLSMNKGNIATAYDTVVYTFNVILKISLTVYYGMEGLLVSILIGYAITDGAKFYLVMKELSRLEKKEVK